MTKGPPVITVTVGRLAPAGRPLAGSLLKLSGLERRLFTNILALQKDRSYTNTGSLHLP